MGFTISVFTILLFLSISQHVCFGHPSNFFRRDYTYLEETESFYKVHTTGSSWLAAKKKCQIEGAALFFPENDKEADAVLRFMNQTQPFYWIFIGVSSRFTKGIFETVDGRLITEVYCNWGPGEPNDANNEEDCVVLRRDGTLNDDNCLKKWPFVCKKTQASLQWNSPCDIPDLSYTYNAAQGKCYKFHSMPMNWTDAYAVCGLEQSYLAVINSQSEADALVKITEQAPKDKYSGSYVAGAVHLGYRNLGDEGWMNIKGQTLEDSGYDKWASPRADGTEKHCGSMLYNGQLNQLSCDNKSFFICEHDIGTLSNHLDDRFGFV